MNPKDALTFFPIVRTLGKLVNYGIHPLFKALLLAGLSTLPIGTTISFAQTANRLSAEAVRQLRLPDVVLESVK